MALLLLAWVMGCGDEGVGASGDPPRSSLDEVGTCRGQLAEQAQAGETHVDWVPLAAEFPNEVDLVFTAQGIEDLGERDIYEDHGDDGFDLPRLARFTDATPLAGQAEEPIETLVSPIQFADATAELDNGAVLLVWIRTQSTAPPSGSRSQAWRRSSPTATP